MIFALPLRTRGTDCGPDRWVTLPAVISYMEHCRWEWLRAPDLGLAEAVHTGHGFMVLSQSIALSRRFGQGQSGQVRCVLRKVGRSVATGDQDLVRDDGVLLAHCSIRGVWVGPGARLTRIPRAARAMVTDKPMESARGESEAGDDASIFDPPRPLRPGELDLKIIDELPKNVHCRTFHVRATDCDLFNHVNGANYVRYVADSLAVQGASPSVHRAELEYKGQARAGDEIDVLTWPTGHDCWTAAVIRGEELLFRATVQTEAT